LDERQLRFRAANCAAITDELGLVDWHALFSRKGVDLCVDIFYDVIWSCFEKFVPRTATRCTQKLPWVTKELNGLKNKTTKAAKNVKIFSIIS
jgi:DNA primase